MIAVDTSALIAMLFNEPEADAMAARINTAGIALVGTPTAQEMHMVALRQSALPVARQGLAMITAFPFELVPFTTAHLEAARDAFDRFGKGMHPAGLNFGDCMAYAVAAVAGCPLLYKGNDFTRTDIRPALA